jgi:V8-like Glu-specific endopeptidase
MRVRQSVGVTPEHSRLGELDLDLSTTALVRRLCSPAVEGRSPDYRPEAVIRERDFLPVWFLRAGFERSRAVAHLEFAHGEHTLIGTGFMVSPNLLLTNHHVFPRLELARDARVIFDYEDDEQGRRLRPSVFLAQPDRFYLANERLDFALIAVDHSPGARWGTIQLRHSPADLTAGARVCIVQHPLGRRKEVVVNGNRITKVTDVAIHYLADTEGGSSGSPVFNQRWELIALHHAGGVHDNVGVRVDRVLKYLSVEPVEHRRDPLLRELLDAVPDSGDLGWFTATGLTPPNAAERRRAEALDERVALDWIGGAEFLDPGHWDLAPVFVGFDGQLDAVAPKLEAIAATVDEAGADMLVLEGIPAPLRGPLRAALAAVDQQTLELGTRALLCLDPAVTGAARPLAGAQIEIAAAVCNGRAVLPATYEQLELSLARADSHAPRRVILMFVELEPSHDLPSRAHRNELARVLGELARSFAADVVITGKLAGVLDMPGLRGAALPELTILAASSSEGAHGADAGALAWIGDGRGPALERLVCWPELRALALDPAVERHGFERPLPIPHELEAAGLPLLVRACFGEAAGPPASEGPSATASSGPGRMIAVDGHVKSIVILDS